jgi:formylglycine-generating enzyme required for sulfatase activity
MTWYEAAHYCDWLSEQDKIPRDQWCYDPKHGVYGPGLEAKEQFWKLKGYRLPTQAEWEFACRAGTVTSRYYGVSDALLPYYARFDANSDNHTWPCGALEPNDFGLFDMFGNVRELCFDSQIGRTEQDRILEDTPAPGPTGPTDTRVLRRRSRIRIDCRPSLRIHIGKRPRQQRGIPPARTY